MFELLAYFDSLGKWRQRDRAKCVFRVSCVERGAMGQSLSLISSAHASTVMSCAWPVEAQMRNIEAQPCLATNGGRCCVTTVVTYTAGRSRCGSKNPADTVNLPILAMPHVPFLPNLPPLRFWKCAWWPPGTSFSRYNGRGRATVMRCQDAYCKILMGVSRSQQPGRIPELRCRVLVKGGPSR